MMNLIKTFPFFISVVALIGASAGCNKPLAECGEVEGAQCAEAAPSEGEAEAEAEGEPDAATPECRLNSDCDVETREVCESGRCEPECVYARDCDPGYACDRNMCEPIPTGTEGEAEAEAEAEGEPDAGTTCVTEPEVCDSADNDCDGEVDEGTYCAACPDGPTMPYYRDVDGDGFGNDEVSERMCSGLGATGWVDIAGDCDDANPYANPGADEVCDSADNDCDGEVDEGSVCVACDSGDDCGPDEFCSAAGVCAHAFPEVCDGADNDGDGLVDEGAAIIGCGGICVLPHAPGEPCDGSDADLCADDAYVCTGLNSVSCSVGADNAEVCNGSDDDCDGTADEGGNPCGGVCPTPELGNPCDGPDSDSCADDTFVCNGRNSVICSAGADNAETCNGSDDDCDGTVDGVTAEVGLPCGFSVGECRLGSVICTEGELRCAGDVLPEIGPDDCDGRDNDCDGEVDEDFVFQSTECGVGECLSVGSTFCEGGLTLDSCLPGTPSVEVCDRADNDCDGGVDEGCACTPGDSASCGTDEGACVVGTQFCATGGVWSECLDDVPPSEEICDNLDNDCDGEVDEVPTAEEFNSCGCDLTGFWLCREGGTLQCFGEVCPPEPEPDAEDGEPDGGAEPDAGDDGGADGGVEPDAGDDGGAAETRTVSITVDLSQINLGTAASPITPTVCDVSVYGCMGHDNTGPIVCELPLDPITGDPTWSVFVGVNLVGGTFTVSFDYQVGHEWLFFNATLICAMSDGSNEGFYLFDFVGADNVIPSGTHVCDVGGTDLCTLNGSSVTRDGVAVTPAVFYNIAGWADGRISGD